MAELGSSDVVNQAKSVGDRHSSIDVSGGTPALNNSVSGGGGDQGLDTDDWTRSLGRDGSKQLDGRNSTSQALSSTFIRNNPHFPTLGGEQHSTSEHIPVDSSSGDALVNGDALSFQGSEDTGYQRSNGPGSDTESKGEFAGSSSDNWRKRDRSNSVKKPTSFKPVSATKNYLAKVVGASSTQNIASKVAGDRGSSNSLNASPTPQLVRPRLVAKTGRDSRITLSGGPTLGIGPDANKVWNRNRPTPPAPQKQFTDEELKQHYGIHMATRLQADEAGKESKWADIDDDEDDWAPETVEWMDGTKSTIVPTDSQPSQVEKSKLPVGNEEDARNPPQTSAPSTNTPASNDNGIPTSAPSTQTANSLSSGLGKTILRPGARTITPTRPGLVLKSLPENKGGSDAAKSISTSSTFYSTKSPWAPIPRVDKASPITFHPPAPPSQQAQQSQISQHQPPLGRSFDARRDSFGNESGDVRNASSQPSREIAIDDFDRSWGEQGRPSRGLFNEQSGRYEPVKNARRGSRNEQGFRPPAVLQRPSQQGNMTSASGTYQRESSTARNGSQMASQDVRTWTSQRRESSSTDDHNPASVQERSGLVEPANLVPATSSKWQVMNSGSPTGPVAGTEDVEGDAGMIVEEKIDAGPGHRQGGRQTYAARGSDRADHAPGGASGGPDARAIQQQLMRERIELNRRRKQEEEAKEEAARKERIRLRMEALGPPPEATPLSNTSAKDTKEPASSPSEEQKAAVPPEQQKQQQGKVADALSQKQDLDKRTTVSSPREMRDIAAPERAAPGRHDASASSATAPPPAGPATIAPTVQASSSLSGSDAKKDSVVSATPSRLATGPATSGKNKQPPSLHAATAVTAPLPDTTNSAPPTSSTTQQTQNASSSTHLQQTTVGQPPPFSSQTITNSPPNLSFPQRPSVKFSADAHVTPENASSKTSQPQHLPGLGQFPPSAPSSSQHSHPHHHNFGNQNSTNNTANNLPAAAAAALPSANSWVNTNPPNAADSASSWVSHANRQAPGPSLGGSVWGPPANDRPIGNGAFENELSRLPPSVPLAQAPHHPHGPPAPRPTNSPLPSRTPEMSAQTMHQLERLYGKGPIYQSFDPTKYSTKNLPNDFAQREAIRRGSPGASAVRIENQPNHVDNAVESWQAFAANPGKYDKEYDNFMKKITEERHARDLENNITPEVKWTQTFHQTRRDPLTGKDEIISTQVKELSATEDQASGGAKKGSDLGIVNVVQSGPHITQTSAPARPSRFFPGTDRAAMASPRVVFPEVSVFNPYYPDSAPPSETEYHPVFGYKENVTIKLPVLARVKLPSSINPTPSPDASAAVIMPTLRHPVAQAVLRQRRWQGLIDEVCRKDTAPPRPIPSAAPAAAPATAVAPASVVVTAGRIAPSSTSQQSLAIASSSKDKFDISNDSARTSIRFPPNRELQGDAGSRLGGFTLPPRYAETKPTEEELVDEREFGSSPTILIPRHINSAVLTATAPPRKPDLVTARMEVALPFSRSSTIAPHEVIFDANPESWGGNGECAIRLPGRTKIVTRLISKGPLRHSSGGGGGSSSNSNNSNVNAKTRGSLNISNQGKGRTPFVQPSVPNTSKAIASGSPKPWTYNSKSGFRKTGANLPPTSGGNNPGGHRSFPSHPVNWTPANESKASVRY